MAGSTVAETVVSTKRFLGYSEAQQHWWYVGAFTALGHLALQTQDKQTAVCIWRWLADDQQAKKELLLEKFRKYQNHTPTGIVLALLRKDCGLKLK